MTNYYYIVASLPPISRDWKFGDKTAEELIGEIKNLSTPGDLELIEYVEKGFNDSNLDGTFYRNALTHRNKFIKEYYRFDLNVRNAKVRYLNKALGRETDRDVIDIPAGDFEQAGVLDGILNGKDILGRERAIDNLYWEWLDGMTVGHYFDMDVILAFILKLHIIDRWHMLDEQTGREMFRKLMDEVKATFKGVEYGSVNGKANKG